MCQVCRSPRLRTSAFCPYSMADRLSPTVPSATDPVVAHLPESRATRPTITRVAAVTGDDVRAAAELCERILEPALGADWDVPVPDLEFTVATVVAHAAETPLWYSVDLWSGRENAAFEVKVLPAASNSALLTSLVAASRRWRPVSTRLPPGRAVSIPSVRRTPQGSRRWRATSCLCTGTMRHAGSGFLSPRRTALPRTCWYGSSRGTRSDLTMTRGRCCCGPTAASSSRVGRPSATGAGTARLSPSGTAPRPEWQVPRTRARRPRRRRRSVAFPVRERWAPAPDARRPSARRPAARPGRRP